MNTDLTEPTIACTFEMQRWPEDEWHKSSGRWDTTEDAARAAAKMLMLAVENSFSNAGVRLCTVYELPLQGA